MGRDGEEAKREAALQLAFYATTRSYRRVLETHGFGDLVDPLREAHGRGDFSAMTGLARPMVEVLAAAGSPDEVREQVARYEGIADRVIVGGAWIGPSPERVRQSFELLLETFGC